MFSSFSSFSSFSQSVLTPLCGHLLTKSTSARGQAGSVSPKVGLITLSHLALAFSAFQVLPATAQGDTNSTLPAAAANSVPSLRILTYGEVSEYGAAAKLTKLFEPVCGCKLDWHVIDRQNLLLSNYLLNSDYDVVFGVNLRDAVLAGTKYADKFAKVDFEPSLLTNFAYAGTWDNPYAQPLTHAAVTVIYNTDLVSKADYYKPTLYRSFKEFVLEDKSTLSIGDPRTNDVGRALARLIAYYFPTYQQQLQAWQALKPRVVKVGRSWSSYYQAFTQGQVQATLTYSSSVIYHNLIEGNFRYQNLQFTRGMPYLVDSLLIAKDAKEPVLAQEFAKFSLSPAAQRVLFVQNAVYPVITLLEGQTELYQPKLPWLSQVEQAVEVPEISGKEEEYAGQSIFYPLLDLRALTQQQLDSVIRAYTQVFNQ